MSKDKEKQGNINGQPSKVIKRDKRGDAPKGYQPTSRTESRVGEPIQPPKKP